MIWKNAVKVLCLTLLMGSFAYADEIADKMAQLQAELNQVQTAQNTLEASPAAKAMHAEAEEIRFGQEANHKAIMAWSAENEQNKADWAAYKSVPPCHYPQGHPEQCAEWQRSMDARYDALEATRKDVVAKQSQLQQLNQVLLDRIEKWRNTYSEIAQQHKLNADKIAKLQAQLNALRNANDACKEAILHGTDEHMHEVCGAIFDGNKP